ncbi:MAG: S8 family serine peptidase [Pseudonocardiaceae bacterium]
MATPGDQPPGSSYGPEDPRSCEERLKDLRTICDQVGTINHRFNDTAVRDDLIRLLQERRAGTDLVQFDPVPDPQGGVVLVVRDELLIRAEALADRRVPPLLKAYGLEPRPVDCLDRRLVRLLAPGVRGSRLVQLAGTLRGHGVNAVVNYVTPMGPVMKVGLGGPEHSAAEQRPRRPAPGPGEPVRVAVIDTGIVERSDGWLTEVVRPDNLDPLDVLPPPSDGFLDFGAGHGTFVAGVIQQVAPGADIAIYQALDSDGIGDKVDVACRMVQAVREGAQILNLSFGLEAFDDRPPVAFAVALEIIDDIAAETGREVLVVAAAGNFGRARPCWPAAFCNVVAVAGLTQGLAPAAWSSRGPWVDCSTLAEGVWSTYVPGKESPIVDPDPEVFGLDAWALWTGTSFAAPQVAGAVAKIAQEEGLPPRQALKKLLAGQPEISGYGRAVRILPQT